MFEWERKIKMRIKMELNQKSRTTRRSLTSSLGSYQCYVIDSKHGPALGGDEIIE